MPLEGPKVVDHLSPSCGSSCPLSPPPSTNDVSPTAPTASRGVSEVMARNHRWCLHRDRAPRLLTPIPHPMLRCWRRDRRTRCLCTSRTTGASCPSACPTAPSSRPTPEGGGREFRAEPRWRRGRCDPSGGGRHSPPPPRPRSGGHAEGEGGGQGVRQDDRLRRGAPSAGEGCMVLVRLAGQRQGVDRRQHHRWHGRAAACLRSV